MSNGRAAIIEVLPPESRGPDARARVVVKYRDLAWSSASDARRAWGYQLSSQGGWMAVVADDDDAIEKFIRDTLEHSFKSYREPEPQTAACDACQRVLPRDQIRHFENTYAGDTSQCEACLEEVEREMGGRRA